MEIQDIVCTHGLARHLTRVTGPLRAEHHGFVSLRSWQTHPRGATPLPTDGLHIAYQVEGSGSLDLIELDNGRVFSVDASAEQPRWKAYVDRLTSLFTVDSVRPAGDRLVRPTLSPDPPMVEQWSSDAVAVLEAEGVLKTAVLGVTFGGLAALLLAASNPERRCPQRWSTSWSAQKLQFEDRGEREVRGVLGTWRLFAVKG